MDATLINEQEAQRLKTKVPNPSGNLSLTLLLMPGRVGEWLVTVSGP